MNRSLFYWCLALGFWSLFYFIWQLEVNSQERALLWTRFLMLGAVFVPITYYYLVLVFLKIRDEHRISLYFGYFLALLFVVLLPTDLIVDRVEPTAGFPFWPKPGEAYIPYLMYFSLYPLYSIFLSYKELKKVPEVKKKQIKLMLFGMVITIIGGSTNYFLWYDIPIKPYGNIFASTYVVFTVYAILRYHLLDIKVIATELFVGFLLVVSMMKIFIVDSTRDMIIEIFLFLVIGVLSYILVRSMNKELQRKEELQTMADDLASANQRLKKLDQAKSEFISIASHQLRTPLTAIKGFISLILEDSYGKVDKGVRGALNKVYLSNERLIQLVEDLLSISRIESGRLEYNFRKWDMQEIVEDVVDMFRLRAREVGLDLKTKLPQKGLLPKVVIDGNKIREVISNLIDNALKYTQSGYVEISVMKRNGAVVVAIQDSGIGVRSEDLPYLFQKFSRGKDMSRLHANGTGLGLYVGRQIIEAHKGKLYVVSEGEGKGSTFYIEIPIDGLEGK